MPLPAPPAISESTLRSSGTYSTFSVAQANAGTLVLQSFMHDERILSSTLQLAEVAADGTEDAARLLGFMLLATLSVTSPVPRRYRNLLSTPSSRRLEHVTVDAPPVRFAFLCASIATAPDRLLLAHCAGPDGADHTVTSLSLARIALGGLELAGHAALRALELLHPDAFMPFPALRGV
jgi:hypothetical protein